MAGDRKLIVSAREAGKGDGDFEKDCDFAIIATSSQDGSDVRVDSTAIGWASAAAITATTKGILAAIGRAVDKTYEIDKHKGMMLETAISVEFIKFADSRRRELFKSASSSPKRPAPGSKPDDPQASKGALDPMDPRSWKGR